MTSRHSPSAAILAAAALIAAGAAQAAETPRQTQDSGAPVGDNQNSKTAGEWGGVMLEDFHLIEKLARFDRERIPERVVHARGTGAEGEFVSNGELDRFTKAALFKAGVKTPVFVRFSKVIHPNGSPEFLRDPHGFATKFYSTEGNWDLVGNNLPVFFIRDAMKFPDMVHSLKPSPVTNKQDPTRFFDFFSHQPESTHMITQLYTDLGTPQSYRTMDGNGVHALKLVDEDGKVVFVKFHWKSQQGIRNYTPEQAEKAGFNYLTDDLYATIGKGQAAKWDLYAKILKPEDVAKLSYNPFDATKDWYDMPEIKVGTMTLNKVPENFFQSTEMSAFSPGVMVPGIEPSPDRLLQGRLFSYADTQRHRLGPNYQQLAVNAPRSPVANGAQDGAMNTVPRVGDVNYQPSRRRDAGAYADTAAYKLSPYEVSTTIQQKAIGKQEPFIQAGLFWNRLPEDQKAALIRNLSADLNGVTVPEIKEIMVSHFYAADPDYGTRLATATKLDLAAVKARAAKALEAVKLAAN
ncbi:catalase [Caulobacter hibisci]|uniref:Catalase n=1 Tax=Caulobacter hibisci TaxID=2035993 RepID=A0ABS0T1U4_9CAUL|nr:catalase [Caulobacter hibisci]MBI1685634.1 catalase [Caulobacter hibisci]